MPHKLSQEPKHLVGPQAEDLKEIGPKAPAQGAGMGGKCPRGHSQGSPLLSASCKAEATAGLPGMSSARSLSAKEGVSWYGRAASSCKAQPVLNSVAVPPALAWL